MESNYNQSLEEICATLAHEIKNPLQLIRANLQLMQLDDTNKQYTTNYDMIYNQLERINLVIHEFMQLERTKQQFSPIKLHQLMVETINDCMALIRNNNVKIDSCFEIATINGYEDDIKKVLINIIKNAVEAFTEDAELKKLSVQLNCIEDRAIIRIIDNGPGLDEQQIAQVGMPFYTTKKHGSGFGLFLSKKIVENHGGQFQLAPGAKAGVEVTITLPLLSQ